MSKSFFQPATAIGIPLETTCGQFREPSFGDIFILSLYSAFVMMPNCQRRVVTAQNHSLTASCHSLNPFYIIHCILYCHFFDNVLKDTGIARIPADSVLSQLTRATTRSGSRANGGYRVSHGLTHISDCT